MLQNQKFLEWFGSMTGLAGAFLLALNISISGYAYILFLMSTTGLIIFGFRAKLKGLVTQQIGYTVLNIMGLFMWLG